MTYACAILRSTPKPACAHTGHWACTHWTLSMHMSIIGTRIPLCHTTYLSKASLSKDLQHVKVAQLELRFRADSQTCHVLINAASCKVQVTSNHAQVKHSWHKTSWIATGQRSSTAVRKANDDGMHIHALLPLDHLWSMSRWVCTCNFTSHQCQCMNTRSEYWH